MELGLNGKVALVTGASRGIGQGIALSLGGGGLRPPAHRAGRGRAREVGGGDPRQGPQGRHLGARPARGGHRKAAGRGRRAASSAGSTSWSTTPAPPSAATSLELTDADWQDGFALKFFAHVRLDARGLAAAQGAARARSSRSPAPAARSPRREFTIGSSVNAACVAFTKALADIGKSRRRAGQLRASGPGRDRAAVAALPRRRWQRPARRGRRCARTTAKKFGISRFGKVEDVGSI